MCKTRIVMRERTRVLNFEKKQVDVRETGASQLGAGDEKTPEKCWICIESFDILFPNIAFVIVSKTVR